MPCPYFSPDQPLAETGWFRAPRAPLGLLHSGECQASAQAQPASGNFHLCNFGYARGVCENFPADAPFDAVRFAMVSRAEHTMELLYILERNHAPAEHGRITCGIHADNMQDKNADALTAQARAFVVGSQK